VTNQASTIPPSYLILPPYSLLPSLISLHLFIAKIVPSADTSNPLHALGSRVVNRVLYYNSLSSSFSLSLPIPYFATKIMSGNDPTTIPLTIYTLWDKRWRIQSTKPLLSSFPALLISLSIPYFSTKIVSGNDPARIPQTLYTLWDQR
jgi:hypothetical protein